MTRLRASPDQIAATDPTGSTWVAANAGSGKTHVLTQRVARLLLGGAEPHKVLSLTYTKAAASEMQTRLFRTLGAWAMAPDDRLGQDLAALAGQAAPVTDPETLARARRLFARALDTPGGLKIQTIHAFCEALLRRFPLEAGVSPRFEVADERRAALLLTSAREMMAEHRADAFDCAARLLDENRIDGLAAAVLARRTAFGAGAEDRIAAHFGAAGRATEAEIAAAALNGLDWPTLAALRSVLLAKGGQYDQPVGEVLPVDPEERRADPAGSVERLIGRVLTARMEARSARGFPGAEVKRAWPGAEDELRKLSDWALATRERICAARMAERTRRLHRFAEALLERHGAAKAAGALLDFDDLVQCAAALLTDSAMRAWVLYKLDLGIDHILVDEAQDTAPVQWQVVAAIAEEFLSGHGSGHGSGGGGRGTPRSIFVVGDEKQSIFSFQGAEPQAFGRMLGHFDERLRALGTPLGRPALRTSYRSAPAILDFVDAVFQGEAAAGLTASGDPVRHLAHRQGDFGRVDLWPLVEPEDAPPPSEWWRPVDHVPATDARERLAGVVADQIVSLLGEGTLAARGDRPARRVRPADILVLVAKRYPLAAAIVRRLKTLDVPVAGADRLRLGQEIAVQDLLALAKVACLPSDDLSLAALLRSPLCGLSEDELFALAHGRTGSLWRALRTSGRHDAIASFLADMAARADYLRPYEFLEHALVRHDGRRRLLARLGLEAEDAIDELLAQALVYEAGEAPSLAGFVAFIEAGEVEVRREMESGGDLVRVMTVHGAKGLEAPIVILPDTISGGRQGGPLFPAAAGASGGNLPELMLWPGPKAADDPVTGAAREAAEASENAERRRLLYVALTRAEDWLILCGANQKRRPQDCWYDILQAAIARCPGVRRLPSPTGTGDMLRFETGTPPGPAAAGDAPAPAALAPLPAWLGPAPHEARRPRLSPSGLAPAEAHGGAGMGRETALRFGRAVHVLLERLGDLPAALRAADADRLLADGFADLPREVRAQAVAEAERVLAMPEAPTLFGPGTLAEVGVVMPGPEGTRMTGRVDRLVLGVGEVLIVDIKTDRIPPSGPEAVPVGYLAQLGAYRAAVAAAWPDRAVATALLWTARPALMRINRQLTDDAFHASVSMCAPVH